MFVLGDSGFGITPHLITPFDVSQVQFSEHLRATFNYQLSRIRVRIEQVFGIIKRLFPFLAIPRLFHTFEKHCNCTEALFVLYNILIEIGAIDTSNISNTVEQFSKDSTLEDAIQNLKDQHEQLQLQKAYDFLSNNDDDSIRQAGKEKREVLINKFIV